MGGPMEPVRGTDGLIHVAYSLLITNAWSMTATVLSMDAVSLPGKQALANDVVGPAGGALHGRIRPLGAATTYTEKDFGTTLPAGQSAIAYFDLTFKSYEDVPSTIAHRVRVQIPKAVLGETVWVTESDPVSISCKRPIRIGSPLRGSGWVNGNGCCKELGPHRLVMNSINGAINPTEAFAIDWVRIDSSGRTFHDDMKDPKNWFGYDADIFAVADGEVVEVVRDLQNSLPGKNPDGLSLAQIAGNRVIMDIGSGHYAEYDHMAPQSILVKVGDKVKRGEKLGKLGNTGNSDSPHLHFQIMDRPSTLDGYALPFTFDAMELEGQIPLTLQGIDDKAMSGAAVGFPRMAARPITDAMPLSRDVLSFR
jgi:hypothetical protein